MRSWELLRVSQPHTSVADDENAENADSVGFLERNVSMGCIKPLADEKDADSVGLFLGYLNGILKKHRPRMFDAY